MDDVEARRRVIEAADRLYYGNGIQAVGMDRLRTESGVSLKRLYSLFSSKEEIVLGVLSHRHQLWTQGLEAQVSQVGAPQDRVLAVYDYLAGWFTDDTFRGCGFINAFGEIGTAPSIAAAVREHKESFQRFMVGLVAQAGGSAELAGYLALLAEGAQTTAAIAGSPDPARQARRAAQTLISAELGDRTTVTV
ncbi:TetR/AcrR family transcriptional regulator [Nocardiopsis ansamitocini]|uniref:TetR family transcriptional regulator n=1 Tax=Nocardiopsis ansamitocini TaxID=1670832 RepID=A0A9W6UJQ0_9ACTN|nr:TetR/AcrR family transcriptional regulator [Nocardiopsis ansamitocini]GLU48290.1 TetR family transcriptional regulator [Nocardiopsis ansamitocini]